MVEDSLNSNNNPKTKVANNKPKSVYSWNVIDVQKWLRRHCSDDYQCYVENFVQHDITGANCNPQTDENFESEIQKEINEGNERSLLNEVWEALEIIESIPITFANYSVAWSALEENFKDSGKIVNTHVRAILDFPKLHRECSKDSRKMLNSMTNNLRRTRKVGYTLLIPIIADKFDTFKEWEAYCNRQARRHEDAPGRDTDTASSKTSIFSGPNPEYVRQGVLTNNAVMEDESNNFMRHSTSYLLLLTVEKLGYGTN
ncbi:hypothetical protein JTB14_029869 [Gonioctena quinquepunctata]|nr:hypothetical protein JTB14_029869 [Gonioctena quinquepunctata]